MSLVKVSAADAAAVATRARRRVTGPALPAAAATLTYFSVIAIVPWLLLSVWVTSWTTGGDGADAAQQRWNGLTAMVPPDMGGRAPYRELVDAAVHLTPLTALVLLFPATFYGEGIRRASRALVHPGGSGGRIGLRARLRIVPLLLVVVPTGWLALRALELAPKGGGVGGWVLRVVVGFVVAWLALTLPLAWVMRLVVAVPVSWPAALLGGLATASFVAGFLQGLRWFLAIPIDLGLPFGGLALVGAVVAGSLWLYALHVVVLVGYVATYEASRTAGQEVAA